MENQVINVEMKSKVITTKNSQVNAILERIHQTIGFMIRTFQLYRADDLDEEDPFAGILAAVAFAT